MELCNRKFHFYICECVYFRKHYCYIAKNRQCIVISFVLCSSLYTLRLIKAGQFFPPLYFFNEIPLINKAVNIGFISQSVVDFVDNITDEESKGGERKYINLSRYIYLFLYNF